MTYGLMSLFFFCFYRMLELQFVYKSFTGKSGYAQNVCVCATKKWLQHVSCATRKDEEEKKRAPKKRTQTHTYIYTEKGREKKRSEQSNA